MDFLSEPLIPCYFWPLYNASIFLARYPLSSVILMCNSFTYSPSLSACFIPLSSSPLVCLPIYFSLLRFPSLLFAYRPFPFFSTSLSLSPFISLFLIHATLSEAAVRNPIALVQMTIKQQKHTSACIQLEAEG